MHPRLRRTLLFLLAGAVAQTAVAWTLPRLCNSAAGYERVTAEMLKWWQPRAPAEWGPLIFAGASRSLGCENLALGANYYMIPQTPREPAKMGQRIRQGFPFYAFEGEMWQRPSGTPTTHRLITMPWWVPIGPLWGGLILNTIFWAALLWSARSLLTSCRGVLRLSRSRCPSCAYPIGASARCSECGVVLPPYSIGRAIREPVLRLAWREHRSFAVVMLLLAGGLQTIIVAWLCAASFDPVIPSAKAATINAPAHVRFFQRFNVRDPFKDIYDLRAFGAQRLAATRVQPTWINSIYGRHTHVYRAGWPLRALQGVDSTGIDLSPQRSRVWSSESTLFVRREPRPVALPLAPMWFGFTVNTIFYAAMILGACALAARCHRPRGDAVLRMQASQSDRTGKLALAHGTHSCETGSSHPARRVLCALPHRAIRSDRAL